MQQTHKVEAGRPSRASGSKTGSCAARESATTFPCTEPGCAKVFSTSRLLGSHQLRHEIDDDEITQVFCAICEHSARDHWFLAYHAFGTTHFDTNADASNATAYFDLCEGVYNAIAQIRQLEEEEKEATTATTRFYPFLRHPGRSALKQLYPTHPAPPTPYFDLAYPLIASLPSSNPDQVSNALAEEHLPADVYDASRMPGSSVRPLPDHDTRNPSPPPPATLPQPTLQHIWHPDHTIPAHLPDLGWGPTSFADDIQNFAAYDLPAAYPLLDAGPEIWYTGAAEQVFADNRDMGYGRLDELLAETIEKWDNASRW